MMTTMAALMGTLPIAIGLRRRRRVAPPARAWPWWAACVVSQLLTLYITPVFYIYMERFQGWLRPLAPPAQAPCRPASPREVPVEV